jgi:hypothetical protein
LNGEGASAVGDNIEGGAEVVDGSVIGIEELA